MAERFIVVVSHLLPLMMLPGCFEYSGRSCLEIQR